jgi:hypothetical protein
VKWLMEVSFSLPTGEDAEEYDGMLGNAMADVVARYGGKRLDGKFETLVIPGCDEPDCDNYHGDVTGRTERFEFEGPETVQELEGHGIYGAFVAVTYFGDTMFVNGQSADGVRFHTWSAFDLDGPPEPDDPDSVEAVLARARNLQ